MWLSLLLPLLVPKPVAPAQALVPDELLVVSPVGTGGRIPVNLDAIAHQMATATFREPTAGTVVTLPNRPSATWKVLRPTEPGTFSDRALAGAAYWGYQSPRARVAMLEAAGHGMVYVNGEPRSGDIYDAGITKIPVQLKSGRNAFLFAGSRGRLRVRLVEPPAPVWIQADDPTLPDLVSGQSLASAPIGIIVSNAQANRFEGRLELTVGDATSRTDVRIGPVMNREIPCRLPDIAAKTEGKVTVSAVLKSNSEDVLHSQAFELEVKQPGDAYRVTFVSEVDGSVQYYAVRPAWPVIPGSPPTALVLSVHGASVEAIGQAGAYGSKPWCTIVCPTNRRPYGFDWEDWGRLDAMEVLAHATERFRPSPDRIYLTGHSMGGHGTWYLGATYPDRFAAIGPAAGWATFWSYGGAVRYENPTAIEQMLLRAADVSDTLKLLPNYAHHGVFVLHGDADQTVPVQQARDMRTRLAEFHRNVDWFEQPSGGHWYDTTPDPGADCVDFAPMFDFFARNRIPSTPEVKSVDFSTISPEINGKSHWVQIDAQIAPFKLSRVQIEQSIPRRDFSGTTENVRRLVLDARHFAPGTPIQVNLDGDQLEDVAYPRDGFLRLEKQDQWTVAESWPVTDRSALRNGGFKHSFNHRFVLVYGTKGTAEENQWSYARARFDAEQWWYRGNGQVEILSDQEARAGIRPDQSVVLYGNADTNRAFDLYLKDCPIVVDREQVKTPDHTWTSSDLATMFLYPKPGSVRAYVAVVGGTGLTGCRATDRIGYLRSGVHYPDVFVFHADMHASGTPEIRMAGYFGPAWGFDDGEFAWKN